MLFPFLIWSKSATPHEIKKKKQAEKNRLQLMFKAFCCFYQGTDLPTAILAIFGNFESELSLPVSSFSPFPVVEAQLQMKHLKTLFFLHTQPETPPRTSHHPTWNRFPGKRQGGDDGSHCITFCYLQEHPGKICWEQGKTRCNYGKWDKLGRFAFGLNRIPFLIMYFYTIFILN